MVILGKFQTVDEGGYSLYVLESSGYEWYGVPCTNSNHPDWTLFDNLADAREYATMLKEIG